MPHSGRRIAILAADQYEDLELWYPRFRLVEAGADVVVAGLAEEHLSKHGYPVRPDAAIADLDPAGFDGVIVPGGWAPDFLRRSAAVTRFVAAIAAADGLVAAICHGGSVLISADVVRGRRMTSISAIKDDLVNAGAEWTDAAVVVDRNLVTSRTPSDLPAFMPAVIAVLAEKERTPTHDDRLLVDGEMIEVDLDASSIEYMFDMLNRMPAAKGYSARVALADHDLTALVRDFVTLSDPRGQLEVDAAQVVDVVSRGDTMRLRSNTRALTVLEGADVPGISRT